MTNLTDLTVAEIRDGFRAGDFSAREVAEGFNANVAEAKALNAFIVETPDHALAAAERNAAERMLRMNEMLEEQIKDRQQAEQRQTALIELGDLLREQHDSQTIAHAAVSVIGRTIGVSRVLFASVDASRAYFSGFVSSRGR